MRLPLVPFEERAANQNAKVLEEALSAGADVRVKPGLYHIDTVAVDHLASFSLRGTGIGRGVSGNYGHATIFVANNPVATDPILTQSTPCKNFPRDTLIEGILFAGKGHDLPYFAAHYPSKLVGVGIRLFAGEKTVIRHCAGQGLSSFIDLGESNNIRNWQYAVEHCNATGCGTAYQMVTTAKGPNQGSLHLRNCTAEWCQVDCHISGTWETDCTVDACEFQGHPDKPGRAGLIVSEYARVHCRGTHIEGEHSTKRKNPDVVATKGGKLTLEKSRIGWLYRDDHPDTKLWIDCCIGTNNGWHDTRDQIPHTPKPILW